MPHYSAHKIRHKKDCEKGKQKTSKNKNYLANVQKEEKKKQKYWPFTKLL